MNTYDIADLVTVTVAFTQEDGTFVDPATVICRVRVPDGTVHVYTYLTDTELIRDSLGHFHVDINATAAGAYYYRWEGTGAQAAGEQKFYVRPSKFY